MHGKSEHHRHGFFWDILSTCPAHDLLNMLNGALLVLQAELYVFPRKRDTCMVCFVDHSCIEYVNYCQGPIVDTLSKAWSTRYILTTINTDLIDYQRRNRIGYPARRSDRHRNVPTSRIPVCHMALAHGEEPTGELFLVELRYKARLTL